MKKILITGCAGFLGFSTAIKFLEKKVYVYGIDNINNYYSKKLKLKRLSILSKKKNFLFFKLDIENKKLLNDRIGKIRFDYVYHFAAQAGVRYSLIAPQKYIDTNIYGTNNLLEILSRKKPKKIFFASSSSIYGESNKFPVKEYFAPNPKNLYADTKIINESTVKHYSELHKMNIYVLRFFTLYGKWGRPDMFLFKLLNAYFNNKIFFLNNSGNHDRDFTYVDDVVEILLKLPTTKFKKKFDVFNLCSDNPINLNSIIKIFKSKNFCPKIKNIKKNNLDVLKTHGSNKKIFNLLKTRKKNLTPIEKTLDEIFYWYKENKIYEIT